MRCEVHFTSIDTKEPWPTARWGSTLTQTTTGALLWGGWSRPSATGDRSATGAAPLNYARCETRDHFELGR